METVVGGRDDRDVFDRAAGIGVGGVEVELRRDDLRSGERLVRLGSAAGARGLAIPSLVLGEHNDGGIASADPAVAEAAAADVRAAVAWASELRADAVLVPFFVQSELVSEADVERAASAFRALAPEAEAAGVALLYEGTLPAARVLSLAERVGSPAFGCYFDLANPLARGLDPPTEIRSLGSLVRRVHVKDMRSAKGDCPPGLGFVDFAECGRALEEIAYDGWLVLETPPAPPPVVSRDVAFVRSLLPSPDGPDRPVLGAFSHELGIDDWELLAHRLGDLGLGAVQVGGALIDDTRAEHGRQVLDAHGISVAALAGYRNLVAPEAAVREEGIRHLEACLELAPRLGTWVVATETGTRNPDGDWLGSPGNWGAEAWGLLEEAIERLLVTAERCGTVLALEAHVNNVLRTQSQLARLLDRFPSPSLGVVADPYNYLSRELLPAQRRHTRTFLERFEHRFVLAHLKDVGLDDAGEKTTRPPFGTGLFEQAPYLDFLRTRRSDLTPVLEHLTPSEFPAAVRRVRASV
jgi:sugar phosphate isomerase/epimerase